MGNQLSNFTVLREEQKREVGQQNQWISRIISTCLGKSQVIYVSAEQGTIGMTDKDNMSTKRRKYIISTRCINPRKSQLLQIDPIYDFEQELDDNVRLTELASLISGKVSKQRGRFWFSYEVDEFRFNCFSFGVNNCESLSDYVRVVDDNDEKLNLEAYLVAHNYLMDVLLPWLVKSRQQIITVVMMIMIMILIITYLIYNRVYNIIYTIIIVITTSFIIVKSLRQSYRDSSLDSIRNRYLVSCRRRSYTVLDSIRDLFFKLFQLRNIVLLTPLSGDNLMRINFGDESRRQLVPRERAPAFIARMKPGLVIVAQCPSCIKKIIKQLKLFKNRTGTFNLAKGIICPGCRSHLSELDSPCLAECDYNYQGEKSDGQIVENIEWKTVYKNHVLYWKENEDQTQEIEEYNNWIKLRIFVKIFDTHYCVACQQQFQRDGFWEADCGHRYHPTCYRMVSKGQGYCVAEGCRFALTKKI